MTVRAAGESGGGARSAGWSAAGRPRPAAALTARASLDPRRIADHAARLSRRRFLRAVALSGAACALALAGGRPVRAALGPDGLLVLPRGRDVVLVQPNGADERSIVSLQVGEFIADVALSPDRSRIAFGMFTARTGDGPGGSDIVVAPAAGGERTVLVPRDRPGMLLAAPQWAPDGSALVFEAVGLTATGQASVTIEWVAADGSGRRTVAQAARYPSFSPDGQTIVSTRSLPTGDAIWEHPTGGGPARDVVPEGPFLVAAYPRYSPDGATIAFAGVGDTLPIAPGMLATPTAPKLLPDGDAGSGRPAAWRGVLMHGFPAEPWVVPAGGGEARALAQLPIDDAAVAWSPDGAWLAVSGASGLFLVDARDGSAKRLSEVGSFGAIDWR